MLPVGGTNKAFPKGLHSGVFRFNDPEHILRDIYKEIKGGGLNSL